MIGRCEYAAAFLLALLVLAGCGESDSETAGGVLIVKERLRGTTLFFEGSRSFATLEAASDGEPIQRELAGYEPGNRALVRGLKPGEYRLSSWVRPCSGNCGVLGAPQDRCATELKIRGDERLVAVITRTNEGPCEIKLSTPGAQANRSAVEKPGQGCDGRTRLLRPGGSRSPGQQPQLRLLYRASSSNPPCTMVFAPHAGQIDISLRVANPSVQLGDLRVWCARAKIPFERLPAGSEEFGVAVEQPRVDAPDSTRCVAVPADVVRR